MRCGSVRPISNLRCMSCDTRSSYRHKSRHAIKFFWMASPFRCRCCGERFYERVNPIKRPSRSFYS